MASLQSIESGTNSRKQAFAKGGWSSGGPQCKRQCRPQKVDAKCRLRKMVGIDAVGDASAYGKRMRRMQMGAGRGNGNYDLWKANCKKRLIGQPKPMWNSKSDRRSMISRPRKPPIAISKKRFCAPSIWSVSLGNPKEQNIEKSGRAQTLPFFLSSLHPFQQRGQLRKRRKLRVHPRGARRGRVRPG